ncbi:hypothetical protein B0H15DRAFT_579525 [Mycena belliarum]|uniref:Uncharacterized protein n=1 Tax=Mycena belliarum TaxID=1033014 RepID=A0AAD6UH02_9AGAR|nr:hypothetical protein B0H15DRAFT_579525 [Mycena belliae]
MKDRCHGRAVQRWRPLEAALAAIGSQAEAVQDCVEDEQDAGRAKPIDIESLLSDIVPSVLGLSGPRFRICQSICQVIARTIGRSIPRSCTSRRS